MHNRSGRLREAIVLINSSEDFFMKLNHDPAFGEMAILGPNDEVIPELNFLKDKIPAFTHTMKDLGFIFTCLRLRYNAQMQILDYLSNKLPSIINTPSALYEMLIMMRNHSKGFLGQPRYTPIPENFPENFIKKLAGNLPWLLSIFPTPEALDQAMLGELGNLHSYEKRYLKAKLLPLINRACEEKTNKVTAVEDSPKTVDRTLSSSPSILLSAPPANTPVDSASQNPVAAVPGMTFSN